MVLCGCPLDVGAWLRVLSARALRRFGFDAARAAGPRVLSRVPSHPMDHEKSAMLTGLRTVVRICPFGSISEKICH